MSNRFNRSMSVDCDLPHYFSPPIAPKNKKSKFIDESDHLLWWHSLDGDEQKKWLITFISHSKIINTTKYSSESTHTQEEKNKKIRNSRNTMYNINSLNEDKIMTPTPFSERFDYDNFDFNIDKFKNIDINSNDSKSSTPILNPVSEYKQDALINNYFRSLDNRHLHI